MAILNATVNRFLSPFPLFPPVRSCFPDPAVCQPGTRTEVPEASSTTFLTDQAGLDLQLASEDAVRSVHVKYVESCFTNGRSCANDSCFRVEREMKMPPQSGWLIDARIEYCRLSVIRIQQNPPTVLSSRPSIVRPLPPTRLAPPCPGEKSSARCSVPANRPARSAFQRKGASVQEVWASRLAIHDGWL